VFRGDEVCDTVGDRFGFAAACAGKDQDRSFGCRYGFTLLGIEAREKVH
jgi:hypothetical protein